MIKLGDKVKDVVTGYTGIVTAMTEYLNGCIQVHVVPPQSAAQKKDDIYPNGEKLDIEQVKKIGDGVNVPKLRVVKSDTGGPPRRGGSRNRH